MLYNKKYAPVCGVNERNMMGESKSQSATLMDIDGVEAVVSVHIRVKASISKEEALTVAAKAATLTGTPVEVLIDRGSVTHSVTIS